MTRYFLVLSALAILSVEADAQTPPTTKRVPPVGVVISETDRAELETGAAALLVEIDAIRNSESIAPGIKALLPDVEIFYKAVAWPVRYNEFFDVKQVAVAKALLVEGTHRAKSMQLGQAPWTEQTGLTVRGYRSRIDGSAQPFGVVIPKTWTPGDKRPRKLFVWNHGRGDTLSELAFINERMKKPGEFTPEDTMVVHPYGRYCNATKFAGETDVFEAIEAAAKHYPIDRERIAMVGFSMGGASTWHLGTHYAGLWAVASPGAGFAETAIYAKVFAEGKPAPPWWVQSLWHLYDATDYAANLANLPVIAYSGEDDPQKQSADIMAKALEAEGLKLEQLVGPKVGHKYEPETKKALAARLDELTTKGREPLSPKVHLVTYTLKYNRQKWVILDAMEKHWERADVSAQLVDEGTLRATTKNVAAVTFEMPDGPPPFEKTHPPRIIIDGQDLTGPPVVPGWKAHLIKTGGRWRIAQSEAASTALTKRHGLQGPIDDAFMDSFVFVRPSSVGMHATTDKWAHAEIDRAVPQWRTVFRGDLRMVDDTALTPEMIANSNIVLWGDPSSNRIIAQILGKLPLTWTREQLSIGKLSTDASHTMPALIFPNPLNPAKYVVLNSSFTFRQGSNTTNALQTPYLPDWALIDLRTPPSAEWPGLVIDAGFFDEHWQLPAPYTR